MERKPFALYWLTVGVVLCGCSAGDDPRASGSAAKAAKAVTPPAEPPLTPAPPAERPRATVASARRPTPPQPETQPPVIRLSNGVARPRTTLTGTLISVSVDYQFVQGEPRPGTLYRWVIVAEKAKKGKRQAVSLQQRGTLEILLHNWRPEMGPFRTHIESSPSRKLSASVPLQK